MYNNETKQWKDIPLKMSGSCDGCSACFLNNRMYVIGSFDEQTGKSMDVLDLKKNEIHEVINMNHRRYCAAIVGLNEKLYFFGGYFDTQSLAKMFDLKTKKWETLPNIPSPKICCYATLVGDLIFVFGHGRDYSGSEIFHVLDTNTNKWIDHDFPEMQKRGFFSVTKLDDSYIIVSGGRDENYNIFGDILVLDTKTKQWSTMKSTMHTPRAYHSSCILQRNKLIVAGGFDGNNR